MHFDDVSSFKKLGVVKKPSIFLGAKADIL